jgi:hypothetical protein
MPTSDHLEVTVRGLRVLFHFCLFVYLQWILAAIREYRGILACMEKFPETNSQREPWVKNYLPFGLYCFRLSL